MSREVLITQVKDIPATKGNSVLLCFMDGVKAEIKGSNSEPSYDVEFINDDTGEIIYHSTLKAGRWSMPNARWYVPWRVIIKHDGVTLMNYRLDLKGKPVLVSIESKSLGDNLSWTPLIEEFRKKHGCRIIVSTHWNSLYDTEYPELEFQNPGVKLEGFFAWYRLGAFNDYNRNKMHWRTTSLQRIASDILGLDPVDVQPRIKRSTEPPPISKPYIAITEYSTWITKRWANPTGWKGLIQQIRSEGYEVMSVSKEPTNLPVLKRNMLPIEETIRNIQHAKALVSVSCGLSVVAWALGIPVIIVSGCTAPWSEFQSAIRVTGNSPCQGCFNDMKYPLDKGNGRFCPTGREFECGRAITSEEVYTALHSILSSDGWRIARHDHRPTRVLLVSPHCSTGGGPQYVLRCAELAKAAGDLVAVVEYTNLSNEYTVQRRRLQALTDYTTLNGNKAESLKKIMKRFAPDVVHVNEFPENFMDAEIANWLYRKDRPYRIVETAHGISIGPEKKKWLPDQYAFVSEYQYRIFADSGIPARVVEYEPVEHDDRPERDLALKQLGLDPTHRHVLQVGLFAPWKNQAESFEIARHLPEMEFHFVGNMAPNFKSYWEPLLANKPSNCRIWGERNDVDSFYSSMDVLLFPSTSELAPIVIKEALSWYMPVVLRPLESYCGCYDYTPQVNYYEDVENAVVVLRKMFYPTMESALRSVYYGRV